MASQALAAPDSAPPPALPPGQELPKIQNVVATCSLGVTLDLQELSKKLKNCEYNPRRFKAVIVRIREPKATALIFHTGSMVCTGTKSVEDANRAAKHFGKAVQTALNKKVKFKDFKIQNVVGSVNVNFPIRLEGLHLSHSAFVRYHPELFPGLIYKMILANTPERQKVILLIFVSGRVVLTGGKSQEHINQAFALIYPSLKEFQKTVTTGPGARTG